MFEKIQFNSNTTSVFRLESNSEEFDSKVPLS